MITKYINTDYEYPIHIYFNKQQVLNIINDDIVRSNELHVYYNKSNLGSCDDISCHDCPIYNECATGLDIPHLIPENFKNEYPELFI